jgi:hypothetical protein
MATLCSLCVVGSAGFCSGVPVNHRRVSSARQQRSLLSCVLLLFVVRKRWLAMGAFIALLTAVWKVPASGSLLVGVAAGVVMYGGFLFVLVRFGLLASAFSSLFFIWAFVLPAPPSFSAWFAGRWFLVIGVMAVLSAYGFVVSLGGRRIFRDPLLEERPRAA